MRLFFALAFALVAYTCALAYADAGAPVSPSVNVIGLGPLGILLVLAAASYFVRKVAPDEHWAHTNAGAAVMALLTGLVPAVYQAVQQKGVSLQVVLTAAAGAIMSLGFSSNPSVASDGSSKAPTPPSKVVQS